MYLDRTGYSGNIYSRHGIRTHAQHVLDTLQKLEGEWDFVACTGKSGMAVAFAALALSEERFDIVTIRKGESSHGSEVEGMAQGSRYIVIDDLIDSGATLERIETSLLDEYNKECSGDMPYMVGVILYTKSCMQDNDKWFSYKQGKDIPLYYPE